MVTKETTNYTKTNIDIHITLTISKKIKKVKLFKSGNKSLRLAF